MSGDLTSANFRSRRNYQKSTIDLPMPQIPSDDPVKASLKRKQTTAMIVRHKKNSQSLTINSPNFHIKTNFNYPQMSSVDASQENSKQITSNGAPLVSPKHPWRSVSIEMEKHTIESHKGTPDKIQQEKKYKDPAMILTKYAKHLTPFEKIEITNYKEIYYFGENVIKIEASKEQDYEDERNDYKAVRRDHIAYRYEILDILGKGSFGQVLKVFDHKTNEEKAIKIIRNEPKFHFQAKIEIKILKFMQERHCADYNIIEMNDFFVFRGHQCLIFDILSMNLYEFLKVNKFKGLSLSLIRRIAIQVLYALRFMRKYNIIHCDLKPENILLKHPNKSGIRLIDFGSSCFGTEKLYTYIQSRFYRSPEVILGLGYDTQIDMWSFGCLLAELYAGFPLFPGDSEADQLGCMMEILGKPPSELLQRASKRKNFFEEDLNPKTIPNSKGKIRIPGTVDITSVFRCRDTEFMDLMLRCLVYDPAQRITPEEALGHSWIIQGLPENLQTQHLKIIQNEAFKKPTGTLSDNRKKEVKEGVLSEEAPKYKKRDSATNPNEGDSSAEKKKDLQLKVTDNFVGEGEPDPAFVSLSSSKHKTNTLQNSALHLESQNTNESIEYKPHRTHRKQPMSTKHASMNFINNIYYLGPINIETSQLQAPKKALSGGRTPKRSAYIYQSHHSSQDNIETIYQPSSDKRGKSLSIDKKPAKTITPKAHNPNLAPSMSRNPYIAYRKLAKPSALFPDIKKA